jgi:hypothetical protein
VKKQWVSVCRTGAVLAVLAGPGAAVVSEATAAPPSRKTDREIRLFERIVDDMLVESPNFLVRNSEPTRGMYISGRGAVFSFRTSLVDGNYGRRNWWAFWEDDEGDDDRRDRRYRDRILDRQEQRYDRGKEEIVEMLVDFGDMMTSVPDGEWLEVEARLRSAEYFYEKDLRRLTYKVKLGDVRAFADGRISESELESRIEMEES